MRLRLISSFTIIVLVAVIGVVSIARQGAASEVRSFMVRGGMVHLDNLVERLEAHYHRHNTWDGAASLIEDFNMPPGEGIGNNPHDGPGMMRGMMNQALVLADENGFILADPSGVSSSGRLSQAELLLALPLRSGVRIAGYLLPIGGMDSGVGLNASDERFLVARLTNAAILGGLVAGGIALVLALYLAYRLIQPVRALTGAANRLSKGDLSQRVGVTGDDELSELARAFNQMATSLEQAQESRRAMTADIAHELRTPLAVQRANLEALQDGIYPLTPENLAPILDQNQLLAHLVDDLQTLALADAGQLKLERTQTDLPRLVERMVEHFVPQADAIQARIVFHSEPNCPPIWVDPIRIEQVLGNLLSNALRHVPSPGLVDISLAQSRGMVCLTIHDNGPGIPEAALAHVFERFYRADRARSRAEGGSGLGLAIARQLAEAHGGALTAANHPQGGAVLTLSLPLGARVEK